ncbi:unnamed protein product, partial [Rotaria sp. Silwood1]
LRSDFSFASYRSDYIYFSLINILGGCINCLSINILGDSGSNTSGTGNMKNHLLSIHQVRESSQTKTTNQHILSMFSRDRHSMKSSQLKQQLGHQLTLMCYRDLLPFSIVENEDEARKDLVLVVLHEFGINSNNIIVVSDQGANMRKAWKLLNAIHTYCIGH